MVRAGRTTNWIEKMLQVEERDGVVYWTLANPVTPDNGSTRMAWELIERCTEIDGRESPPVAVVLVSQGPAFWMTAPASTEDCDAVGEVWATATSAIGRLTSPTVAAIGGDAVGPAWELALACDLRVVEGGARLGSPELTWGRMPAAGGTQRLARLVGRGTALRLLLLAELLDASTAYQLGLVQRIAAPGTLWHELESVLDALRKAAPIALTFAKEAVLQGVQQPLEQGLRLEADLSILLQTTQDRAEGVRSFVERRDPHFRGE
jgi:enoyl-CoA hydratase/carnithine racemase